MSVPQKISLDSAFATFTDHFSPRIAAELNGQHVKLVRFAGPFVWHSHPHEDEMFFIWRGSMRMEFRERTVVLEAGDMLVVPRGVEHRPDADAEVLVVLFEPAGTLNTGDAAPGEKTVAAPKWLGE
jgi:mannose-6-phosphate isomerase-like protein (cupin superfamily)